MLPFSEGCPGFWDDTIFLHDLQCFRLREEGVEFHLIDRGFDPVYGARPLKRYLQSRVETLIARRIIAGDVEPGSTQTVDMGEDGGFVIRG